VIGTSIEMGVSVDVSGVIKGFTTGIKGAASAAAVAALAISESSFLTWLTRVCTELKALIEGLPWMEKARKKNESILLYN